MLEPVGSEHFSTSRQYCIIEYQTSLQTCQGQTMLKVLSNSISCVNLCDNDKQIFHGNTVKP